MGLSLTVYGLDLGFWDSLLRHTVYGLGFLGSRTEVGDFREAIQEAQSGHISVNRTFFESLPTLNPKP